MLNTTKLRQDARKIFDAGLQAVDPKAAVHKYLKCGADSLEAGGQSYLFSEFDNIFVVGAGKAGAPMAAAVEEILGERISKGVVNVKYDHTEPLRKIKITEAGHPVPDQAGLWGTLEIVELLESAGENDLIMCLISGGGSALLPLPIEGISLAEKQALTEKLLACGATINEINSIRKHISKIKGGQFARLAFPATLITLILSDVVGDPLDAIASGPAVPDPSTFQDAKDILNRYGIWRELPISIQSHLQKGLNGEVPETPKPGDRIFSKIQNVIVGNNTQAVLAAKEEAQKLGYNSLVLSSLIEGETKEVAGVHAAIAREILNTGNPLKPPACIISGGETTVTLRGDGKGGRNQEFVLAAAIDISGLETVVILSGGTDGSDGPTDAAGAICDGQTIARAKKLGMNAMGYLSKNDAYSFFKPLYDLLMTGPTKTNVMDLRIILAGAD